MAVRKGQAKNGRFEPGNTLAANRKDTVNRIKREIAAESREAFGELHARIMERLGKPKASVFAMIEYADLLAKRGWGAPPKKVSLPGDDRSPFAQLVEVMESHSNEAQATKSDSKGEGGTGDEPTN
jgi:hypothetical protein